jgi:hypothetical protein
MRPVPKHGRPPTTSAAVFGGRVFAASGDGVARRTLWLRELESGRLGLAAGGGSRLPSREQALDAEVEDLKAALGRRRDPPRRGDAGIEVSRH